MTRIILSLSLSLSLCFYPAIKRAAVSAAAHTAESRDSLRAFLRLTLSARLSNRSDSSYRNDARAGNKWKRAKIVA